MWHPFIPHILEAWEQREEPNLFFTTYENMNTDLRKVATDLLRFLRGKGIENLVLKVNCLYFQLKYGVHLALS